VAVVLMLTGIGVIGMFHRNDRKSVLQEQQETENCGWPRSSRPSILSSDS
jgi:hypothetical protein